LLDLKNRRVVSYSILIFVVATYVPIGSSAQPQGSDTLTVEQIFGKHEFDSREYGPVVWNRDGQSYTLQEPSKTVVGAKDIVKVAAVSGVRTVLVSARMLIPPRTKTSLSVQDYEWSKDNRRILLFTNAAKVWRDRTRGDYWVLDVQTGKLAKMGGNMKPSTLMFAKFSPDGNHVGYVHDNNLYIENSCGGHIRRLTNDGSRTTINGTSDWVYEEELGVRDCWRWSPDGKSIAYWQFDSTGVKEYTLINDTDALYPTVKVFGYPKAGEKNSAARIGVISADGGRTRWMKIPGDPREHYLARMDWADNSRELVVQQLDRLQHTNRVMLANTRSGSIRTMLWEKDGAWLETFEDSLLPGGLAWIEAGRAFLWMSERSGWRRIYRVSKSSGDIRPITMGEFDVDHFNGVDEARGWLYYTASPENATQRYLFRARLDGKGSPERMSSTTQPGSHTYDIGPKCTWAIHTWSRFGTAPKTELVRLPDNQSVRTLEDNSVLQGRLATLRRGPSEFFQVDIGGGVKLDGWMMKPPDFDPSKRYPLLVYVYGEPAGLTVVDAWTEYVPENYPWHLMMTQQGYIVASVENRGTPTLRGRAWRRSVYEKIGTIASHDQAYAVRELSKRPYIDSARIGIWGWSGGGSNTLNCMFRYPDVFKVGMAVAPVPDILLYDTIYQERYMGLPQQNPEAYRLASPITFAEGFKGDLLLVHGTGDDNVHFQGTERLINKLVDLGKPVSLMIYPNRTHMHEEGAATHKHLFETMTRFLNDKLRTSPLPTVR
jgi:dipeptidyl-peptidase-4